MSDKEMRELDAWIAERVMGWTKVGHSDYGPGEKFFVGQDRCVYSYGFGELSESGPCFSPTTDPAAAMIVLEKCAERGKRTEHNVVIFQPVGQEGGLWGVGGQFAYADEVDEVATVYADTLLLSICLFAKELFK